jgi:MFS family permease
MWSGAFVSNVGTWMQTVAIGIYVTEVTDQATWTGTVAAAGFVPIALLAPLGGALADRVNRRTLLATTSLVQALIATVMTVLFIEGDPTAPILTLLVFLDGVAAAIGFPAYQAVLPELVPEEELPGAVSLSSTQYNLGRVVGPALAGIVIAIGGGVPDGLSWALALNAVSFLAVVVVVLSLDLAPPIQHAEGESLRESMLQGARFVRRDPGLRVSFSAMCVNTLLAAPFIALVPAMAQQVLDEGERGTSILVTAQGIGAVAMGLMLGTLTQRYGPRRVVITMLSSLPVALACYALAPGIASSAIALVFVGAFYLGCLSSFFTIAQLRAPAHMRGRVVAVNNIVLGSLYPLGAVIQGKAADWWGLRATTLVSAILLAAVWLTVRAVRPGISRVIEPATAAS